MLEVDQTDGRQYNEYLLDAIKLMLDADAVYMLANWKDFGRCTDRARNSRDHGQTNFLSGYGGTLMLKFSKELSFPIDAVTQTFAFLGRRGSGKTYGAGKLAELFLDAGAQIVALDPIGNWYGLRLSADGKGKGFSIPVFGGERGDVPLEPQAGALIAKLLVEERFSAVLDLSTFRKEQRKQFATDFAEGLPKVGR